MQYSTLIYFFFCMCNIVLILWVKMVWVKWSLSASKNKNVWEILVVFLCQIPSIYLKKTKKKTLNFRGTAPSSSVFRWSMTGYEDYHPATEIRAIDGNRQKKCTRLLISQVTPLLIVKGDKQRTPSALPCLQTAARTIPRRGSPWSLHSASAGFPFLPSCLKNRPTAVSSEPPCACDFAFASVGTKAAAMVTCRTC